MLKNPTKFIRPELRDYLKSLGETKTKQEEDQILQRDYNSIKEKFEKIKSQFGQYKKKKLSLREFLVRCMYCEFFQMNMSFTHLYAIGITKDATLAIKKLAYLFCFVSIIQDKKNELGIMLVNSFHMDLASKEWSNVVIALENLVNAFNYDKSVTQGLNETIYNLVSHKNKFVRVKALLLYSKVTDYDKFDSQVVQKVVKQFFIDSEPYCMQASVALIYKKSFTMDAKTFGQTYCKYFDPLVNVMRQNLDHKLPPDYDYHKVPSPWFQIHCLRIMALILEPIHIIGSQDKQNALRDLILYAIDRNNDPYHNGGYMVLVEYILFGLKNFQHPQIVSKSLNTIYKLVFAESNNLVYQGLKCLYFLVKINSTFGDPFKVRLLNLLEYNDPSITKLTNDVMIEMVNGKNIKGIVNALLKISTEDTCFLDTPWAQKVLHPLIRKLEANLNADNKEWMFGICDMILKRVVAPLSIECLELVVKIVSNNPQLYELFQAAEYLNHNEFRVQSLALILLNRSDCDSEVVNKSLALLKNNADYEYCNSILNIVLYIIHSNKVELHTKLKFTIENVINDLVSEYKFLDYVLYNKYIRLLNINLQTSNYKQTKDTIDITGFISKYLEKNSNYKPIDNTTKKVIQKEENKRKESDDFFEQEVKKLADVETKQPENQQKEPETHVPFQNTSEVKEEPKERKWGKKGYLKKSEKVIDTAPKSINQDKIQEVKTDLAYTKDVKKTNEEPVKEEEQVKEESVLESHMQKEAVKKKEQVEDIFG